MSQNSDAALPDPETPKSEGTHKLWGGRLRTVPLLDAINHSIATDFQLWPHDVRLSRAWALGL